MFITQHCPVYDTSVDVCYILILQGGWTPLMLAARGRNQEVVKYLVTHGSQLEATSSDGHTAVHYAAKYGQIDITKWLIDQGCSPWVKPLEKYFELLKSFKKMVKFKKAQYREKIFNSLTDSFDKKPKDYWEILKGMKNKYNVDDEVPKILKDEEKIMKHIQDQGEPTFVNIK
ncbi:unnamed protein product [Mytilus edulis]|uniref:Uncharacterized protein n=1 Tax=Mytilus edulis TaxID=6550 RepID=A0A8S3TQK7_MYTED|nr:unnamed protein product [Mytilus edulis]